MTEHITLSFQDRSLTARAGESIAAVLLRHGIRTFRETPAGPRAPVCGMGVCFECSVLVTRTGGRPMVLRACATPSEDGMHVEPSPNTMQDAPS